MKDILIRTADGKGVSLADLGHPTFCPYTHQQRRLVRDWTSYERPLAPTTASACSPKPPPSCAPAARV